MGQRIRSKAVQHGYHYDQTAYRDNQYVRCSRCGFICNLDRDLRSSPGGWEGWGYNFVTESTYSTYDDFAPYYVNGLYDPPATYDNSFVISGSVTEAVYLTDTNGNIITDTNGNPILISGGMNTEVTGANTTYDNLLYNVVDPVINAGCPQCGTMLYDNPATHTRG